MGAAARIVPNVPSFAVDGGFWYSIPEHLADSITVGSIVRVPLSGRRVRGWVVEVADDREGALKDILGVSGDLSVFDTDLLSALEWAANHYVAPMSVVLSKATPPNLPRRAELAVGEIPPSASGHPLDALAASAAIGKRRPAQAIVGPWHHFDWIPALEPALSAGKSAMVVCSTAAEVGEVSVAALRHYGPRVITVAGEDDKEITEAWNLAQNRGVVVVGTPRVALWLIPGLAIAVVLEEGRRAMKDRQTPTIHVREMMRSRSRLEGFGLAFFGPTPSVETLAAGAEVIRPRNRAWPPVEVVDMSAGPPGSGTLDQRSGAAIRAMADSGRAVFVLTTKRHIEEVDILIGDDPAVTVGTERDLAGLGVVELVVALGLDALEAGTGYRASEEALRLAARLANRLAPGPGHRMIVQTRHPDSELIRTLVKGDPIPYLERILVERARTGFPPSTETIVLEVRGELPPRMREEVGALPTRVLGPAEIEGGVRWLLQGSLDRARSKLRELASRWRESGATVRIDADPIDL